MTSKRKFPKKTYKKNKHKIIHNKKDIHKTHKVELVNNTNVNIVAADNIICTIIYL